MKYYAVLGVSLKEISVCVVDADGAIIARKAVDCDPGAVAGFLEERGIRPERVVHESGPLSIWLQRGLVKAGHPATCIDARTAQKPASAKLNTSDTANADGMAHLARTGWFTPVHVRSEDAAVPGG